MESQYNETVRHIGRELRELIKTYNNCMQRILNKYGLYPGQPSILFVMSKMDGMTQNEIARELGVSKASVGVSLRRMEKSGFVRRVQDKNDTRCNRVILTQKGLDYIRWCEIDFNMVYTTMLEDINGDKRSMILENLKCMKNSLLKLQGRLTSKYIGSENPTIFRQTAAVE
ncbi:MAG: transcriptional regulator SlyA [Firmicutes bacterium ADurb.Bin182]|nr:MAG: transcriptional regulator SlyA [Firmicutes bacterium ADurb.Bin182]